MWCWALFFLRDTILYTYKNVLMPLEPKLLVMCEGIGEVLEIVYDVLTLSSTNRICAKECAEHHGMAIDLSGADW
jgi:hypothetical protein